MFCPRVLLAQRIFPRYRLKLFEALAACPAFKIDFAYGDPRPESSIEVVQVPRGLRTVPLRNIFFGRNELATFQFGLGEVLRRRQYDVLIAEFNPRILSNMLAWAPPRRIGRFIWWGQGVGPRTGAIAARVRARVAGLSDAAIFYDRQRADALIALGLPARKVHVAPNSIDIDAVKAHRLRTDFRGRQDVLFIGRLTRRKRVDVLIRAFSAASPSLPPNAQLTIVGDGPERPALTQLASQLNLAGAVRFVGAIYDERHLAEYFNRALASVCVGDVGLGAIHSLAYGVPMIATHNANNGPEISALRDTETALFIERGDQHLLRDALVRIGKDGDLWMRMSQECTTVVERDYGIGAMVRAFERAILGDNETI